MAKPSFSVQLDDVQAPGPVPVDKAGIVQSGVLEGEAIKTMGDATAGLVKFLGTTAISAAKGKMEADEESAINDILKKTSPLVEQDITRKNQELAGGLMASFESEDYAGAQTVRDFTDEARRYAEARRQGAITRDEALAQIGAVVKKYSAMAPGFASDFRKVGAELTGISNVDVFGVHQALTTQSAREKAAIQTAEADLALRKEAAGALGLTSLDDLTPGAAAFYRSVKQAKLGVDRMEAVKKAGDMQQDQADRASAVIANGYIQQAVGGLASEFAQLGALNLSADTPEKQLKAQQAGGMLAAKLDVMEASLISQIKNLTTGKNAMSADKNKQLVDEVQSTLKTFKDAVKTQEGFNTWTNIVKNAKGNAGYIVDQFKTLNPHFAILNDAGVMSKFVEAMVAMGGNKDAFAKMFGKEAAETTFAVLRNPNYATALGAVAKGDAGVDDVAKVDPKMGKVMYNDIVNIVDEMSQGEGVLNNNQKMSASNMIHQWLAKMDPAQPANLKKFVQMAGNPDGKFWSMMEQLDPAQRKHALVPLFDKMVLTTGNTLQDLKAQVEAYNNAEGSKQRGRSVSIKFDALTSTLRLETQQAGGPFPTSTARDVGSRGIPLRVNTGPAATPAQREALDVIRQRLMWLNTVPDVMARALPMVNDSSAIKSQDVAADIYQQYQGQPGKVLTPDLVKQNLPSADVPGNPSPDKKVMRSEADIAAHVADLSQPGEKAPTAAEMKDIHTRNISELEKELANVKGEKVRAILEAELANEKKLLVGLQ